MVLFEALPTFSALSICRASIKTQRANPAIQLGQWLGRCLRQVLLTFTPQGIWYSKLPVIRVDLNSGVLGCNDV